MGEAVGYWLEAAGRHPLLTHREELELGRLVQEWQQWPGGVGAAPAAVRRRGLRARDRMVTANLRLVVAVVRRYGTQIQRQHLAMEDGFQEGVIGLQRGVEKFDPTRGYKFSTYGYWWIRQAVGRWVHTSGLIRVPQNVSEQIARVKREADLDDLEDNHRARIEAAMAVQQLAALDGAVAGGDGSTLLELLSTDVIDPLEQLHWQEEAALVAGCDPEAWAVLLDCCSKTSGLTSKAAQDAIKRLKAA